ncbi:MAG TPA: methylmalonyl-CoA mutase family protein, partial [Candidatus Obscuribacter sp.]|nr:methylmalonyl-CoA mutase family protein [Candidatus Obscuribacter sp.]
KDEAIALPTEASALTALRTQQIIAFETGVGSVVDPCGGSYYIENLTSRIEAEVEEYLARIEEMGGAIKAVETGFIQKEIQDSAYEDHQEVESKRKLVVGVNSFIDKEEEEIPVQRISPELESKQVNYLKEIRAGRDQEKVNAILARLSKAAQESDNLVPIICEAVEAYASVGEITGSLRQAFGKFRPMVTI